MTKEAIKLMVSICFIIMLATVPFIPSCAAPSPAPAPTPAPSPTPTPTPAPAPEPVTLKAVAFLPNFIPVASQMGVFAERIGKISNGLITVDWLGGPEVIGGFEQPGAVSTGVVDMNLVPTAYYKDKVPEAFAHFLTADTPWGERESGYYDWMLELHKQKMNVYYLGRVNTNVPFYTFVNPKVSERKDLKGLKLAASGLFIPAAIGMGASPVNMSNEEYYTAVERKTVDGHIGAMSVAVSLSLQELTDYFINHPFFESNVVLIVNLDTWNKLSKEYQDMMIQAETELEHEWADFFAQIEAGARQKFLDAGTKAVTFSSADAQSYLDGIYNAGWEEVKKGVSPEAYNKLREYMIK